jgi:hypothetical protein
VKRLTLKSEYLAELSSSELVAVAGGARTLADCLTGMYPSVNVQCPADNTQVICYQVTNKCPTWYCTGTTSA